MVQTPAFNFTAFSEDGNLFDDDGTIFVQSSAASPLAGFTVIQEYDPLILDYRKDYAPFWDMIPESNKKYARSPTIQKIKRDKRPHVGFADRMTLANTVHNRKEDLALNLQDPGQPVRALTGSIDFSSHFARSMARQQNFPYGDEIAENTDSLMKAGFSFLEASLFRAVNTPESPHAFNGLQAQQTQEGHVWRVNKMADVPENIVDTVNDIATRVATDRYTFRRVSHLLFTGAAYTALQKEVRENSIKVNEIEITPGVIVPAILAAGRLLPIVITPFLDDVPNENGNNTNDIVRIYPIDINSVEWHGVIPEGGSDTFEPQIFDLSASMYASQIPLTQKRMMIQYGTPYLLNEGLWRIDIQVPRGRAWSYDQQAQELLRPA